ncbi:hypothetical protein ACUTHA_25365, partial [Klebsiella pneumoniae]
VLDIYSSLSLIWRYSYCLVFQGAISSKDAVERQMSHQERNTVRAAYIHKAEHLGERRLMLQWWADYLDANKMAAITPFDYAKINSPFR